ncbi:uncharacterized protein LOC131941999 [Physella acuta]|uniref:uncharacterized protein LOC131941999 n=1 Tax=Physella acuta TaxID=109671 RepID=UPI0027DAC1DD|nr:uncharacterized protein LOC131941999 [Physella acuta]
MNFTSKSDGYTSLSCTAGGFPASLSLRESGNDKYLARVINGKNKEVISWIYFFNDVDCNKKRTYECVQVDNTGETSSKYIDVTHENCKDMSYAWIIAVAIEALIVITFLILVCVVLIKRALHLRSIRNRVVIHEKVTSRDTTSSQNRPSLIIKGFRNINQKGPNPVAQSSRAAPTNRKIADKRPAECNRLLQSDDDNLPTRPVIKNTVKSNVILSGASGVPPPDYSSSQPLLAETRNEHFGVHYKNISENVYNEIGSEDTSMRHGQAFAEPTANHNGRTDDLEDDNVDENLYNEIGSEDASIRQIHAFTEATANHSGRTEDLQDDNAEKSVYNNVGSEDASMPQRQAVNEATANHGGITDDVQDENVYNEIGEEERTSLEIRNSRIRQVHFDENYITPVDLEGKLL